jgi:hypothetical protein
MARFPSLADIPKGSKQINEKLSPNSLLKQFYLSLNPTDS